MNHGLGNTWFSGFINFLLISNLFSWCHSQDFYIKERSRFEAWEHSQDRIPRDEDPSPTTRVISHNGDQQEERTRQDLDTYSTLKSDPKSSLPHSFTICATTTIFKTQPKWNEQTPFLLLGEDGRVFLNTAILSVNEQKKTTTFYLGFGSPLGKAATFYQPTYNSIPIIFPNQWSHSCISMNTETGRIRFVVNGYLVEDKDFDAVRENASNRPIDLKDRLILGIYKAAVDWGEYNIKVTSLNIFSKSLSIEEMQEISTAGSDMCGKSGDYLAWEDMEWELSGPVTIESIKVSRLCEKPSIISPYVSVEQTAQSCMNHCKKLNGRSPPVRTEDEWRIIQAFVKNNNIKDTWLSLTDVEEEGIWRDLYTKEATNYSLPFTGTGPNGGEAENCAISVSVDNWVDWFCDDDSGCLCNHLERPFLQFRGVCPKSRIDRLYLPNINRENPEQFKYISLFNTSITYDNSQWILTSSNRNMSTVATSKSPENSFLLGTHTWSVKGDVIGCDREEDYTALLKLTGCKEGEFTCKDGECVSMDERCDQVVDCLDESDERNCDLLVLALGYNNKVPPITTVSTINKTIVPAQVNISVILIKIVKMEEVDHKITFQFSIILEWREPRAKYHNLKTKTSLNILTDSMMEQLWLPNVIYTNTDQVETVRLGQTSEWDTTMTVTREGEFVRSPIQVTDEIEIFSGSTNRLTMRQTYTKTFQCQYQLSNYPFDTQVCYLKVAVPDFDTENVRLHAAMMELRENKELTMYTISKWNLMYNIAGDLDSGVKMMIMLKRRIQNELLTTYLPSTLLAFITFATMHFKSFFFEAALTVNITTMLVITTIFISVMQSLPSTAYIKHIDIWLIGCQLLPFLEVVILTVKEKLRDDNTINHHGSVRVIQVAPKTEDGIPVADGPQINVMDNKKLWLTVITLLGAYLHVIVTFLFLSPHFYHFRK